MYINHADNVTGQLFAFCGKIKAEGRTTVAENDWTLYASCSSTKLNTQLYPGRPKVSFILQYYKRPWMINQIVETLKPCQQLMPVEMVVNVDNPDEHADW